jgi:hypothetical protein
VTFKYQRNLPKHVDAGHYACREGNGKGEIEKELMPNTESTTFTLSIGCQKASLFVLYVMKTYWEVNVRLYTFLPSALYKIKWSTSSPDCFALEKRAPTDLSRL